MIKNFSLLFFIPFFLSVVLKAQHVCFFLVRILPWIVKRANDIEACSFPSAGRQRIQRIGGARAMHGCRRRKGDILHYSEHGIPISSWGIVWQTLRGACWLYMYCGTRHRAIGMLSATC